MTVGQLRRIAKSRAPWLWAAAVIVGLGLRVILLPYKGTHDMDVYLQWGHDVSDRGLADAYHGIYFPLQYQLFQFAVWLSGFLGVSEITSLKLVTLVFDSASFVLLALLLKRLRLPPAYALIYWLHPYFLTIFCLGYIDAQVGTFVLGSLLAISYSAKPAHYLAAGIPLGFAFVMKPQVETILAMIAIVAIIGFVGQRRLRLAATTAGFSRQLLLLLAAPAAFFAAYSILLAAGGHSLLYLAHTYSPSELARQSSSLNANMLNVWYLVADQYRHSGQAIYEITKPAIFNLVGTVITLSLLAWGATVALRSGEARRGRVVAVIFAICLVVAPMTLTHAHENHMFYGGVLSLVLIPIVRKQYLTIGVLGILLLQWVNLVGYYGLGMNSLTNAGILRWSIDTYSEGIRVGASWATIILFGLFIAGIAQWSRSAHGSPVSQPSEAGI